MRRELPELSDWRLDHVGVEVDGDGGVLIVRRGTLGTVANISPHWRTVPLVGPELVLATGAGTVVTDGAVVVPPESAVVVRLPPG